MAKDPAFPWYASDWLGSTRRALMTPEQRSAYVDLMCYQWGDETCSLPDDDEVLAKLSGLGEGWFKGGSEMLRRCFPLHPSLKGRIANPKLLQIRAERDEWIEKSRQGGVKSGETRRLRRKKGGSTTVPTKREPNANSPSPSPSPSSIKPPTPFTSIPEALRTDAFEAAWSEWQSHRVEIRKKLTPRAAAMQLKKLDAMGPARAVAAIENSIAGGYTGIFEPDDRKAKLAAPGPGQRHHEDLSTEEGSF